MKYTMLKYRLIVALFCVAGLSLSGCINDFLDECYYLRVKIVNANGDEITGSVPVSLYIYDENGEYLETKSFEAAELRAYPAVKLDYPANKKLQIVSWSDIESAALVLTRGEKIDDLLLNIKNKTADQSATSDQAYCGNVNVIATSAGGITQKDTIVLRPQIGQIYIYTEGFQYALNNRGGLKSTLEPNCDYTVNNSKAVINHKGERVGSEISCSPETEWRSGELYAPPSIIASGDTLDVALNLNNEVMDTRVKDINGNYIIPPAGKQVLVIFEYGEDGAFIGIRQVIRDWGVVDDDIIL